MIVLPFISTLITWYNVAGNPDILICGNCRELFNDIVDMLEHKKIYCKMRFTCKCESEEKLDNCNIPEVITCGTCSQEFEDPWDLMEHVQVWNNNLYSQFRNSIKYFVFMMFIPWIFINFVMIIKMSQFNNNPRFICLIPV